MDSLLAGYECRISWADWQLCCVHHMYGAEVKIDEDYWQAIITCSVQSHDAV
jgi:hypothetical protein